VLIAVIKPLPLTVITGTAVELPNEPVLEFTVASVALVIAVPVLPDRVKSPPVTDIEPDTAAVVTAVIKPLPLTVITGTAVDEPKEPVLLLTVASVKELEPAVLEASPENAGSRPASRVPLEILEAFSDVREAPEPLGLRTSVPIATPKLVLAVAVFVKSDRLFALVRNVVPEE
jgi:hypothetical protein